MTDIAKPLPANLDAERSVLGAALISDKALLNMLTAVRDEDFFLPQNRLIFRAIQKLTGQGVAVDLLTLTNDLTLSGELERAGGAGYVAGLSDGVPHAWNVLHYAKIIREQAKRRELIHLGEKVQELAYENRELSAGTSQARP
jgi:replicative DNA helicase